MSRIARKMRLKRIAQAAEAAKSAANTAANSTAEAAAAEQQAITNASAITDSGRKTEVVTDTTERPANSTDDLAVYINDMRNRRRNKGALLPQISGVLGQVGALGV